MSNININYKTKEIKKEKLEVPLFIAAYNSLYQVVKNDDDTYSLVSTDNGYVQATYKNVKTIEEILEASPSFSVVDVEITVLK